jgi:tetratricopeptide (TPR) repeat protein
MERVGIVFIASVLGVLILRFSASGQEPERKPPAEDNSEAMTYAPPAWKSVEIGNYYLRRKKLRGALGRFQEAAQTDAHYAPAYLGLGKVYDKLGLKQKALLAYQRYLDELPSTKDAVEAKDAQKAIARLQRQLGKSAARPAPATSAGSHSP